MTALFFHNYYGEHERWMRLFCESIQVPFDLYYNVVEDSVYNVWDGATAVAHGAPMAVHGGSAPAHRGLLERLHGAASGPHLRSITLRLSPNQGKDIGGKLVLMDAYLRLQSNSDYILFVHDKKSPYKIESAQWQQDLLRVIAPDFAETALAVFASDPSVGIVAAAGSISNEHGSGTNQARLRQLEMDLALTPPRHDFVAGTMFWARSLPLSTFFQKHPPLEIRKTLERGNVLDEFQGTQTHSWERMLSWLIIAQGFSIKGL
jgi:lipopolysaccharide biosynthesis protein